MKRLLLSGMLIAMLFNAQAQKNKNPFLRDSSFVTDSISVPDEPKVTEPDNIATISLSDDEFKSNGNQNVSSQLTAGRDPFAGAAAFNFSAARFRLRGYDADFSSVYINGIRMENEDNGAIPYGLWGGLNDAFRNADANIGARYNTFSFGNLGVTTNISIRASKLKKQTSFGYAVTNRNYHHRLMLTQSTGMLRNGWAFLFSGSMRYAGEGYVDGTFYRGGSWLVAADKKLGEKQVLSIVAFEASSENGRAAAATAEMMTLANSHYYNPYWGYQNGRKRNASVAQSGQPVIIVTHDYHITNKTNLVSSVSALFGRKSVSGLDWFNAPDPRPDYYRYLPSFYASNDNTAGAKQVTDALGENAVARQVNWDVLYNVNRENHSTINDVNGQPGNSVAGNRSLYIIGDRVDAVTRFAASTIVNTTFGSSVAFTGGVSLQSAKNHYFQRVNDLLGGQFWMNVNQFAQRDFPGNTDAYQNDLNHPNRAVTKGGHYGYDYTINTYQQQAWAQLVAHLARVDLFFAGESAQNIFYRTGNVRNGLFPDHSFGKSESHVFTNASLKTGATYKINGRQYLYLNGAFLTRAPYYSNAYVSPRTRDFVQSNLRNEAVQTVEGGYVINTPKIRLRATGYYTRMQHGVDVMTFYYDQYNDFVNYALSNIDKLYFGSEIGAEIKVAKNITLNTAASIGRYYYNSRQHAVVTVDNTAETIAEATIYSKNFRIGGTPQEAYSAGLTYRSPRYWFVSLTANYLNEMWLAINPLRRTYAATDGVVNPDSQEAHAVLDQMRLPAQYTVDFYAGYSWRLKKAYGHAERRPLYLNFNLGVSNLTNNKNIINGGYEQLRYDFSETAATNLARFAPKFTYAYGLTYFVSAQLHF